MLLKKIISLTFFFKEERQILPQFAVFQRGKKYDVCKHSYVQRNATFSERTIDPLGYKYDNTL